jgi:hypothetical protein
MVLFEEDKVSLICPPERVSGAIVPKEKACVWRKMDAETSSA